MTLGACGAGESQVSVAMCLSPPEPRIVGGVGAAAGLVLPFGRTPSWSGWLLDLSHSAEIMGHFICVPGGLLMSQV